MANNAKCIRTLIHAHTADVEFITFHSAVASGAHVLPADVSVHIVPKADANFSTIFVLFARAICIAFIQAVIHYSYVSTGGRKYFTFIGTDAIA